jgi:hypothetical protein
VISGAAAYKAAPLFRVSVSYLYRAPGLARDRGREAKLDAHDEALRAPIAEHPGFDA